MDHCRNFGRVGVVACIVAAVLERLPETRSEEPDGVGQPATNSNPEPASKETTQRIRQLIYFFRNHRVFSRDEEWARTIRELATIGRPAVPELVAELDRTDRDATLRSLAFTLRAIGDPRAVPALIRAIPKALRAPGSDCGVAIDDVELRAFMKRHDRDPDDNQHVSCGRPVNEILDTLTKITGHQEPQDREQDKLRGVFLGGTEEQHAGQRKRFEERREHWQTWWMAHWQEFVTADELKTIGMPPADEDPAEAAGLAKFGPLFPTSPNARLGPVRELQLDSAIYANGKSHVDFDTGRVYEYFEGIERETAEESHNVGRWWRQHGIDVRFHGSVDGVDLYLWLVDDNRWETLENEIKGGQPLQLGREATGYLVRFDKHRTDFKNDQRATFLFTTREGGRGILQIDPPEQESDRRRLRYRMFAMGDEKPAAPSAPESGRKSRTPFDKTVIRTVEIFVPGKECLLDLESRRKISLPADLGINEASRLRDIAQKEQFADWCRQNGIDLIANVETVKTVKTFMPANEEEEAETAATLLCGLGMTVSLILPGAFGEMTVEQVREIISRPTAQRHPLVIMESTNKNTGQANTYAFKTREGSVGILQFKDADADGHVAIRYQLHRQD